MKSNSWKRALTLSLLMAAAPYGAAHATVDGLDSTTGTMHISVQGEVAMTLTAVPSTGIPNITFVGPLNEGSTSIQTDGTLTMTSMANLNGGITVNQNGNQALSVNSNQIWKSVTTADSTLYLQYSTPGGAVMVGGAGGGNNNLLVMGNVGVGTGAPQTTLDVNGPIKPGYASSGAGCSPEGAMAYDMGNHAPVYCGNTGLWTTMGGALKQTEVITGGQGNLTTAQPHDLCIMSSFAFWAPGHLYTINPILVQNGDRTWSTKNNSGSSGGTFWNETVMCYN